MTHAPNASMVDTAEEIPSYRLGHDRRYLTWLTSDFLTGLSSSLARFAIPLIALAVTGSPVEAGVIAAVGQVASLVSTMVGGVLADRQDRMRLMIFGGILGLAIAVGFTMLALADALMFTTLLAFDVLLSIRSGVFGMAGEALVKDIVPAAGLGRAQSANQGRDAALSLAGGPLGGVLLAVGAWLIGAVMVVCQSMALIAALILRRAIPKRVVEVSEDAEGSSSALSQAKEGILWLYRRKELWGIAVIATVVNLGFTTATTTVIYSLKMSGTSLEQIGLLSAAIGAAMLVGAAISPFLVVRVSAGALAIAGLVSAGIAIALMPLVTTVPSIAAVLGAGVLLLPSLNAGLLGYMMVATPTELLGRASSAISVMAMAAIPLAPLIAGFGLEWIGRTGTLLIATAICALAILVAIGTPSLRSLPKESGWVKHADRLAERHDYR